MRHDYDFVVQLHRNAVRDAQIRAINASLFDNLALASPVSRVVAQEIAPFQMKAYRDNPKLEFANGRLRLSTDIRGGARGITKTVSTCRWKVMSAPTVDR